MRTLSTAVTTGFVVVVAVATAAAAIRSAEALLGGLPAGSELVAWAFVAAALVASMSVSHWAHAERGASPLAAIVFRALVIFAVAGFITAIAWYGLFYASGSYDKGGYQRLATALGLLVVGMVISAVVAARLIANASGRDTRRIATVVALMLLTFLVSLTIPSLI